MRPLGEIQNVISHLDQYEIDEISILRPVRCDDSDSDFKKDVKLLSKIKSSTPISFGGGIRNLERLKYLDGLPFERFIFSSILFQPNLDLLYNASLIFGKQALIGLIPFDFSSEELVFNSSTNEFHRLNTLNREALEICDEIITYDTVSEGENIGFNLKILCKLSEYEGKLVYSGGIFELYKNLSLYNFQPKAMLIENKVLHTENSIKAKYGRM